MKSEYRCLVESIIGEETKLAEAAKLHAKALESQVKAAETLTIVSKRLETKRAKLRRLDELLDQARPDRGGGKAAPQEPGQAVDIEIRDLRADVKSLQASVKMLSRESMRTTA